MLVSVLGPLVVRDEEGRQVDVSGTRLRVLLVRLALDARRFVSAEALVDAVWGDDPPAGAANALQSLVSRLRRALGVAVESGPAGYRLVLERDQVDAARFELLATRGAAHLARGESGEAYDVLAEALALWRGPALADVAAEPFAAGRVVHLEERHTTAREDHAEAALLTGRSAEVVADLGRLAAEHPLRERPHALLMRALDAAGRRPEALAVHRELTQRLADELGLDASQELSDLQMAILRGTATQGTTGELREPGERPPGAAAMPPAATGGVPGAGHGTSDPHMGAEATTATSAHHHAHARPPTNLPVPLTSFVGRTHEVARIGELLTGARLLALVGPGGAGKTRLAVESAARLLDHMPGGVWFAELAPVRDPDDIAAAVVSAVGQRSAVLVGSATPTTATAAPDPVARAAELIATGRPTLLILDNCEHVVDAAARLADRLLALVPELHILSTTREPLGVGGEILYPLGPLRLPPPEADDCSAYDAVRLFTDRARSVRPDLDLDDTATAGAVAEIVRRLDGMPLAIELAAARTRALTPVQIAARLDDRFRLLTAGSRTALPRHQTLRAVVEWSWDLLGDAERAVLRRLSVFRGGATLDAAERVLADPQAPDVLDALAGLVDKSLVQASGDGPDGARYRMLETIQAYATERLEESGEAATVRDRHGAWLLGFVTAADPMLRTRDQLVWMRRLDAEHDNIAAALRHLVDRDDVADAVGVLAALAMYWLMRGNHTFGEPWLADGMQIEQRLLDDRVLRAGIDPEHYARVQLVFSLHGLSSGEPARALRAFARARWTLRRVDPSRAHPLLMIVDGLAPAYRNDYDAARRVLERTWRVKDPWTRACADLIHGQIAVNSGLVEEAAERLGLARTAFAELGDNWGLSGALEGLAELSTFTGDHRVTVKILDEAIVLLDTINAQEDISHLLLRKATALVRMGDVQAARAELDRVLERMRTGVASPTAAIFRHMGLACIASSLGDLDTADEHLRAAKGFGDQLPFLPPQASAMLEMSQAQIAMDRQDWDTARTHLAEGVRYGLTVRDMPVVASCLEGFATYALGVGDAARGARLMGAAAAVRGTRDWSDPGTVTSECRAREALGDDGFTQAFDAGFALDREGALALADEGPGPAPATP